MLTINNNWKTLRGQHDQLKFEFFLKITLILIIKNITNRTIYFVFFKLSMLVLLVFILRVGIEPLTSLTNPPQGGSRQTILISPIVRVLASMGQGEYYSTHNYNYSLRYS
jgi:hypothetical protein